jgi:hypothetical protein
MADQQESGSDQLRQPKVFISYARSDSAFAKYLVDRLTSANNLVFYDQASMAVGDNFADILKTEIEQADIVIVLVSPSYFSSQWAQAELATALSSQKRIIPILVQQGEIQGPLRYIQFIDATKDPGDAVEYATRVVEAAT